MELRNWRKIQTGDKNAFKDVFDTYYASLCLYANSIIHDMDVAQDVVSDCFIRIWESRARIEIKTSVKYYLLVTVRNALYAYLKSPESRKEGLDAVMERLENTPVEEYNLEKDKTIQRIHHLILQLPEQRRTILELAAFQGMTYPEIAEELSISVNTVKTQMARSYRYLREYVADESLLLYFFFSAFSEKKSMAG